VFHCRVGLWLRLSCLGVCLGLFLRSIRLWGLAVLSLCRVLGLCVVRVLCIGGLVLVGSSWLRLR